MTRISFLGIYVSLLCLMTAYLSKRYDLPDVIMSFSFFDDSSEKANEQFKIKDISLAILKDGSIRGYVTFSLVAFLKKKESLGEDMIRDCGIRAAYGTIIPDIRGDRKPDLGSFEETLLEFLDCPRRCAGSDAVRVSSINFVLYNHDRRAL